MEVTYDTSGTGALLNLPISLIPLASAGWRVLL